MRFAGFILPVLLLSSACSMKKNLDDMHEKTTSMADTTDQMNNRMVTTNDLMGWLGTLTKQGMGATIRGDALKDLRAARTLNKKIEAAICYLYGFEFQVYSPMAITNVDVVKLRHLLMAHAVAELGKTLPELLPKGSKWKLDATDDSNSNLNLMALSAVLHRINPLQIEQLNGTSMRPMSMFDLLVESLAKKARLNSGEISRNDLTELDREVLREEQAFRHLLRLRFKTLPVIALGRVSHIQNGFFSKLNMLFKRWTPQFVTSGEMGEPVEASALRRESYTEFADLNLEQIEYAADVLDEAIRTRRFLLALNSATLLDSKIERIYRNMETASIREGLDSVREAGLISSVQRFDSSVATLLNP